MVKLISIRPVSLSEHHCKGEGFWDLRVAIGHRPRLLYSDGEIIDPDMGV
jgi:hypothetical protein